MSGIAPKTFRQTTVVSVTASSQVFPFPTVKGDTPVTIRVVADIGVHLKWGPKDSTVTATQDDGLIPSNTVEYISMGPTDEIGIVSASGTPTGNAWFTVI